MWTKKIKDQVQISLKYLVMGWVYQMSGCHN